MRNLPLRSAAANAARNITARRVVMATPFGDGAPSVLSPGNRADEAPYSRRAASRGRVRIAARE